MHVPAQCGFCSATARGYRFFSGMTGPTKNCQYCGRRVRQSRYAATVIGGIAYVAIAGLLTMELLDATGSWIVAGGVIAILALMALILDHWIWQVSPWNVVEDPASGSSSKDASARGSPS